MKHQPTTIRLSFCIYGDYFEVDRVTDIIGLTPTETAYKGDPLKYRVSEETFWEYKFAPIETLLVEDCLAEFEQMVKPVLKELSAFIKAHQLTTQLRFCVNHYEINAALTFETTILDILHQLNGEIDIDQYFYK